MALSHYIYLCSLGLNGFLMSSLLWKRAWRSYPAFMFYVSFNSLHSLILFHLYGNDELYTMAWVCGRPVVFVLKIWIVAEILKELVPVRRMIYSLRFAAFFPAPWLATFNIPLERSLGFILALLVGVLAASKKVLRPESYAIVTGLFLVSFFTAIAEIAKSMSQGSWLTYVPTYAYSGALLLWIRAFRRA